MTKKLNIREQINAKIKEKFKEKPKNLYLSSDGYTKLVNLVSDVKGIKLVFYNRLKVMITKTLVGENFLIN
jgi:hypothetical protein